MLSVIHFIQQNKKIADVSHEDFSFCLMFNLCNSLNLLFIMAFYIFADSYGDISATSSKKILLIDMYWVVIKFLKKHLKNFLLRKET